MRKMVLLLIEDDINHCDEYKKYIKEQNNSHILNIANGYKQGIDTLAKLTPDVIILDLEYNSSDGDGFLFLKRIKMMEFKIKPYIIVITNNLSSDTHNIARKLGADYIFTKLKIDYSPKLVIDLADTYFSTISLNVDNDSYLKQSLKQDESTIKSYIEREMEKLGFTYDMAGRKYLVDAIYISTNLTTKDLQLSKDVYPLIAKKYKKSDQNIEKSIGNAIKKVWRTTDINTLARFYTVEVNYTNGVPKNKEFITYFAQKHKA